MSTLTDKELIALRRGSFELHCLKMELKQMTDNGLVFSGSGFIKQLADGRLQFTLYDPTATPTDDMELLKISTNAPLDKITPEQASYQLSAIDGVGRNWITSPFTYSMFDITEQHGGSVLRGPVMEMSCSFDDASESGNAVLNLELFQDLAIPPMSSEGLRCDEQDFDVSIHKREDSWEIQLAVQGNTFPENIEAMLLYALGFVLARPLEWSILMKHSGNRRCISLRSKKIDTLEYRINPPILVNKRNSESFWQIFLHCLQYIYSDQENKAQPIFAQASAVCRASVGFEDTKCLALCVAVESILNVVVKDATGLSQEDKQWRDRVREYIDTWEGPKRLSQRIKGFLGDLSSITSSDRFETLISTGAITRNQKDAWKKLRNRLVHKGDLGSDYLQMFLDWYNPVLVLFYHIVFHEIGYKGRYTDYSTPGRPERDYGIDQGPVTNTDAEVQITEES